MMNDNCHTYEADLLAFLEGALGEDAAARLRAHLDGCAACREEYAWLKTVGSDLEAMGDAIRRGAPSVDLVDPVMEAVAQGEAASPARRFEPRRRARGGRSFRWTGLAAAAVLLIALGLAGYLIVKEMGEPLPPELVEIPSDDVLHGPKPEDRDKPKKEIIDLIEQLDAAKDELRKRLDVRPPAPKPFEPTEAPATETVTVAEVIKARRQGATDPAGLARLRQLASLTPEQARDIIRSAEASLEAVVGASLSIGPEEAQLALLTVVGQMPDEPYPRFELAKAYSAEPETAENAVNELALLHDLDPDNAVIYGLEALVLLDRGDLDGALAALEQLRAREWAGAYSLQAALDREQALVASGLDPNVARLLSALTAGADEADFLRGLGEGLIEHGRFYAEENDLETAQAIYESVNRLGLALEASAQLSQERLAAIDIQNMAIELLRDVYAALESVQGIEALTHQTESLNESIRGLLGFFGEVNDLFAADFDLDWLRRAADLILEGGDLALAWRELL